MTAAEAVRRARGAARLSQRELAARAGMPQSTVGRIETGAIEPRAVTLERLLRATGHELSIEPHYGGGVDRSLIRWFLRLTPKERIQYAAAGGDFARRLRAGGRRAADSTTE